MTNHHLNQELLDSLVSMHHQTRMSYLHITHSCRQTFHNGFLRSVSLFVFSHNSNSRKISLFCTPNCSYVITTNFCTSHSSFPVMPCIKTSLTIWFEMQANIYNETLFHQIWISCEKIIRRAPGLRYCTPGGQVTFDGLVQKRHYCNACICMGLWLTLLHTVTNSMG